jgi:hypothetical protein
MENNKLKHVKLLLALIEHQETTNKSIEARYKLERLRSDISFTGLWNKYAPSPKEGVDKDAFFAAQIVVIDTCFDVIEAQIRYKTALREEQIHFSEQMCPTQTP